MLVPRVIRSTIPQTLGITFSWRFAGSFNYPWKDAYTLLLDEVGVKNFRLPVYWDDLEPNDNQFDFSKTDWQVDEAEKRGAKVILAIGRKVPRWPECFIPDWAKNLDDETRDQQERDMVQAVVSRYSNRSNLIAWQVENEPFFPFGDCPSYSINTLRQEINLVRKIDPSHEIIITQSGELAPWFVPALFADKIGISIYRTVWNKSIGYVTWPLPAEWYFFRTQLFQHLRKPFFVSELQSEPWFYRPISLTSLDEQKRLFPPYGIEQALLHTKIAGFSEVYLWGAEWWYWMKTQGHSEYIEAAAKIFKQE
jgi:hypothetical protein